MLSSGMKMLSSGMKCYHLELMSSSETNVIIWDEMLSSGMKCYHLEIMLSSGTKCYHLEQMLSSGANVIIWDEMPSSGANVIICIYCYHLVLSCDVIIWDDNTPLFIFPGNFTHSYLCICLEVWYFYIFFCPWLTYLGVSEVFRKNKKGMCYHPRW